MTSLKDVRSGLATAVSDLLSIPAYSWPPDAVEAPCAVIAEGPGQFLTRSDDSFCHHRASFSVVLVIRSDWNQAGYDQLDDWVTALASGISGKKADVGVATLQFAGADSPQLAEYGGRKYLTLGLDIEAEFPF